jgi:abortive infection bacteriophage resistance protein
MSFFYSGMKKPDQIDVAETFGITSFEIMTSWLCCINVARNICAHHSRFWNKPNAARPAWPNTAPRSLVAFGTEVARPAVPVDVKRGP